MKIEQIFKNNSQWAAKKLAVNENYFKELAKGQSPEILYIGCSDSRVPAEEIMGADLGEIFVHRNIANMVIDTDLNAISVINFAVSKLKVKHIIVCGHYYCGGVHAAMQSSGLETLNPWLMRIKDVYHLHQKELDEIKNETEKYQRLVELNVEEQCINVTKLAYFQKAYKERELQIHGWVFDVKSGKLIDLKLNFKK